MNRDSEQNHVEPKQPKRLRIWLGIAGLLLITLAVVFFLAGRPPARPVIQVHGAPRLLVQPDAIDLGDQKNGTTAHPVFRVTNIGDKPLQITRPPYVVVKEGCCPPTPQIGAMTLDPGASTTVEISFSMGMYMDGKHDFRLHLETNDPTQPDREITILSNWGS